MHQRTVAGPHAGRGTQGRLDRYEYLFGESCKGHQILNAMLTFWRTVKATVLLEPICTAASCKARKPVWDSKIKKVCN